MTDSASAYYRNLTATQLRRLWLEPSDKVDKRVVENELLKRGLSDSTDNDLAAERREKFERVLLTIWVVLLFHGFHSRVSPVWHLMLVIPLVLGFSCCRCGCTARQYSVLSSCVHAFPERCFSQS